MNEHVKTEMHADGLRYVSKAVTRSDFPGAPGATMSCIRCGRHRPRSTLRSVLLAGRRQYCCSERCDNPPAA